MTLAAAALVFPLPATEEWGEGQGEGFVLYGSSFILPL